METDLNVNSFYIHKDGGKYAIKRLIKRKLYNGEKVIHVEYSKANSKEVFVRTEKHFKSSFTEEKNLFA